MPTIQEVLRDISESRYLIHAINRQQAQMLVDCSKPGTFLIRFRENVSNSLAVHMYHKTPLAVEISSMGIIYKNNLYDTMDEFVTALMKAHPDLADPILHPFNYYEAALSSLTHVLLISENLPDVTKLTPADINSSKIIHLEIFGNDIVDEVIPHLSQALTTNQTIKFLKVYGHLNYREQADINLAKSFIENVFASSVLEGLHFSGRLNVEMIETVFEGLEKNTCLKELRFSVGKGISTELLGKFLKSIQNHPTLTDVDVNVREFSEESFSSLKLLLTKNFVIKRLAIDCPWGKSFSDFAEKKIPEFFSSAEFAQNTSLTAFSLGDVDIEHSHLEQNRSLSLKNTCIRFFRNSDNRAKVGSDTYIKSRLIEELQDDIFGKAEISAVEAKSLKP